MNPIRRKVITEQVAKQEGVNPDLLDQIVSCYYSHVSSLLSGAQHPIIDVPGLGMFSIKGKTLSAKILKTSNLVTSLESATSLGAFALKKEKETELNLLRALQAKREAEYARQQKIKSKRHESGPDLEEQGEDL